MLPSDGDKELSPIEGLSPLEADYDEELEEAPCTETVAAESMEDQDSDIEIEQDAKKSYLALEIVLYKRANEPSGIEFLDVPRLRKFGALHVKAFVDKSFILIHNTACYENGMAEGLIEGDMIIQVNMTSGPPFGAQGGDMLAIRLIADAQCQLVIHRRTDRHSAYCATIQEGHERVRAEDIDIHVEEATEEEMRASPILPPPTSAMEAGLKSWADVTAEEMVTEEADEPMEQAGAEASDLTVANQGDGRPPADTAVPPRPRQRDVRLIRCLTGPGFTPLPDQVVTDPNAPEWRRGTDPRTHKEIFEPEFRKRDVQGWPLFRMRWNAEARIYNGSLVDQRFMISEKLVKTIRHHCVETHLRSFTKEAWVDMQELWANCPFLSDTYFVTDQWIRHMAQVSKKARFEFIPDTDDINAPIEWIRAKQGHSIPYIRLDDSSVQVTLQTLPEVAVHATAHVNVQPILASGIRPGGPRGGRCTAMSQMFWNGDDRMTECGRKRADCGIQWDCRGKIESGQQVFITGSQVLNTSTTTRRPLILRAVMMRGSTGPPGWKDVIYERRNDCPEALLTDQRVQPGEKGNFTCTNHIKSRNGEARVCGGFCFWGTYWCQSCGKSLYNHYDELKVRGRPYEPRQHAENDLVI